MQMDEKWTIELGLPYGLIMRYDALVDYLGLNPYLLQEWLADSGDIKYITITPENAWILDYVKDAIII